MNPFLKLLRMTPRDVDEFEAFLGDRSARPQSTGMSFGEWLEQCFGLWEALRQADNRPVAYSDTPIFTQEIEDEALAGYQHLDALSLGLGE